MGIYAVWGPPQSGKTSLAIDLAFALSLKGKSVCLISPELYSELAARLNIRIEPEKSRSSIQQTICFMFWQFLSTMMPLARTCRRMRQGP